jgi:hypothetical protein
MTAMDYRLTTEDLNWLRKLREAKAANRPLHDIPPTSVLRKLTLLGCAQVQGRGEYSITLRGRDELLDRELESQIG